VASASFAARTTVLALLLGFAAIALLLAVVGVYGVMAYTVAQQTRDLGLHMALGADARDVRRLVLRQGLTLAALGVLAGSLAALAATRALGALLYGISPTDLPTFAVLAAALLAVAAFASYLPARRAARIDPAVALRS
jgi:ABC-type antimicrobial peptide transport system permease subunit